MRANTQKEYFKKLRIAFRSKVRIKANGCWEWSGYVNPNGYGRFDPPRLMNSKFRSRAAHRVSYELLVGKIPQGKELHHKCENRACVNPKHLVPLSHRENVLLGKSATAVNAQKTHCASGHAYSKSNTLWVYRRMRQCRACSAARQRKRYEERKEAGR